MFADTMPRIGKVSGGSTGVYVLPYSSIALPPNAEPSLRKAIASFSPSSTDCPVIALYWLSGMTAVSR